MAMNEKFEGPKLEAEKEKQVERKVAVKKVPEVSEEEKELYDAGKGGVYCDLASDLMDLVHSVQFSLERGHSAFDVDDHLDLLKLEMYYNRLNSIVYVPNTVSQRGGLLRRGAFEDVESSVVAGDQIFSIMKDLNDSAGLSRLRGADVILKLLDDVEDWYKRNLEMRKTWLAENESFLSGVEAILKSWKFKEKRAREKLDNNEKLDAGYNKIEVSDGEGGVIEVEMVCPRSGECYLDKSSCRSLFDLSFSGDMFEDEKYVTFDLLKRMPSVAKRDFEYLETRAGKEAKQSIKLIESWKEELKKK